MTSGSFANWVLRGGAGLFALASAWCLVVGGRASILPCAIPTAAAAIAIGLALRLGEERRLGVALTLAAILAALWAADAVVALFPFAETREQRRVQTARDAGLVPDTRSLPQLLRDLRRTGVDAYPTVYVGNYWRGRPVFRDSVYPLGGISGVISVMCSEASYVIYRADERGLTNPPGQWRMPRADIAAVGDSYTQGWCVRPPESFAARIRARYPATIVAGLGASGPLVQLAQMREFLAPLRPRVVLWFYFENNDLADLTSEIGHPILSRYLEPGFTQHLADRQAEVDDRMRALAAKQESTAVRAEQEAVAPAPRGLASKAGEILRLKHLRARIAALKSRETVRPCCDLPLYRRVVQEAKTLVEGWGGHLMVVYLPSEPRLSGRSPLPPGERAGERVVAILDSLRVPVLDLRERLRAFGSVRELFAFRDSHYSVRGHEAVATLVLGWLQGRDSLGITPVAAR